MADQKSFIMYCDYIEPIKKLKNEDAGILIKAILSYVSEGELIPLSDAADIAFSFIKTSLDRDKIKWEETKEKRSAAGRAGGFASAKSKQQANDSNAKQTLANVSKSNDCVANQAVNVSVNVNDNVNVNDIESTVPSGKRAPKIKKRGIYENVKLTDADFEKLQSEFPFDWEERIERLSEYIAAKGDKYKCHIAVIRSWAKKDAAQPNAGTVSKTYAPQYNSNPFLQMLKEEEAKIE